MLQDAGGGVDGHAAAVCEIRERGDEAAVVDGQGCLYTL